MQEPPFYSKRTEKSVPCLGTLPPLLVFVGLSFPTFPLPYPNVCFQQQGEAEKVLQVYTTASSFFFGGKSLLARNPKGLSLVT